MRRDRHRTRSSGIPSNVMLRLSSGIVLLLILGLIYSRARDPRTWRWLAEDEGAPAARTQLTPPPDEVVVPGPTDLDEADDPEVQTLFAAIGEKAELAPEEMPAYWRSMCWARAQTFEQLQERAEQRVPYTRFFDEPEKYRARPIRLRLHIKKIESYEAPTNPAGVKTVYEVWGTTDESRTYFYVVVCPELPAGMPTGSDINEEGVFVGYFLKVMPYQAAIKRLAAPLLIGRLRGLPRPAPAPAPALPAWLWIAGVITLLGVAAWGWRQFAQAPARRRLPASRTADDDAAQWFEQAAAESPAEPGRPPTETPDVG